MAPAHMEKSHLVLVEMAKTELRQMWYDIKITAISHFYAERGRRYAKKRIIELGLGKKMSHEDFMAVIKFSFYSMSIVICIICS